MRHLGVLFGRVPEHLDFFFNFNKKKIFQDRGGPWNKMDGQTPTGRRTRLPVP